MKAELHYAAAMLVFGIFLAALYHLLLFCRAVLIHKKPLTDAEDIFFFGGAGIAFFLVVYRMNDGIIRWYAYAGALLGGWLYIRTAGRLLEPVRKWLLKKQKETIKIKKKRKRNGVSELETGSEQSKSEEGKKKNRPGNYSSGGFGVVRRNHARKGRLASGERGKGKVVS